MQTDTRRRRWGAGALALGLTGLLACGALAAACGGGPGGGYNAVTAPTGVPSTAAATAPAQPSGVTPVKVGDTALGKVLTDARGFTLYTFKGDVPGNGKSAAEALAALWPPLSLDAVPSNVAGAPGAWAVFTRNDGKMQVTYQGSPLYTYAKDQAPGDTKGDKVDGVWFASIMPQPSANLPAVASMPMTQNDAPAAGAPRMVVPPPAAAPSPMARSTMVAEPTKSTPAPQPTVAPSGAPSGGSSYGY